ncbi:hypothetical protein FQN54_009729 [Arachnomyces sp. PD_36]|nr:hypothetical protein FQN54_009729 [Arachnomyces sp. PD_36]
MAISKTFVSVNSLSTASDDRPKNALASLSRYLNIVRNRLGFRRREPLKVLPEEHSPPPSNWRPTSLNPIILISVAVFNALVITVLGILQWISNRDGGLYFAEKDDDIPAGVTFLHLYFPTIIAVAYSVVWSWIDLDVKRLEPWFQMSQSNGAEAQDSVLLHYPVDFIASVPINAARRKHWTVVWVSTVTVALFWAVTPLQSAIFSVGAITRTRAVPVTVSSSLIPLDKQADKLNTGFLNDGYATLWLGQDLPPFTTKEYTLGPLKSPDYQPVPGLNKTITYPTKRYETILECYPPVDIHPNKPYQISADDGRGCQAKNVVDWQPYEFDYPFLAYYIGYFDDPYISYSLAMGGCSEDASNKFLAIYRRTSRYAPNFEDPSNATALFCEPSYFSQPVDATVTFPDYSVVETVPTGPKKALTSDDFMMRRFHYILGTGVPPQMYLDATPQADAPKNRDIADSTVLYQNSRLENASIGLPTTNMVGFAIGSSKLSPEQYMNASVLGSSYQAAHKLLFSLAAHDVMTPPEENPIPVTGEEEYTVQAVTLVQTFTFLVQGFLFSIIILTLLLLYFSWKRPIALRSDPGSMSEVMSLSTATNMLDVFKPFDSLGDRELTEKLEGTKFKLLPADNDLGQRGLHAISRSSLDSATTTIRPTSDVDQTPQGRTSVQPKELHTAVGIAFILFLVVSLGAIVFLNYKIHRENGLPLPSKSAVVEQLLTNFLPTALATFMEPWWIVLNRLTCLLQPFKDLSRGNSPAQRTLSTKYTSLPPQLIFWRAAKSGHLLLVIISFTGLLSNILTVSLSGLFIEKTITEDIPVLFSPLYQPQAAKNWEHYVVDDGNLAYEKNDHYYVAMSNISTNTNLPPWVTPEFYFLPVNLTTPNDRHVDIEGDGGLEYQLVTTGIGADLDCLELSETTSERGYGFSLSHDATEVNISTTHTSDDGDLLQCSSLSPGYESILSITGKPDGMRAAEFWPEMYATATEKNASNAELCKTTLFGGWIRANLTEHPGKTAQREYHNVTINSMQKMFLSCQPRVKSAEFRLRVDGTGLIIDSARIGPFNNSLGQNMSIIADSVTALTRQTGTGPVWHNDSLAATDWTNYLLKLRSKSDDIVDPTVPVPEFDSTVRVLEDVYRRLFAILLGIHSEPLVPADENAAQITGFRRVEKQRLFFSEPMFILSVIIYVIDIVVALAIYIGFRKPFLPKLPTTIAANIATFAASHIPELLSDKPETSPTEATMANLDRQGYRYAFGEYTGTDGKTHLGVDRDQFVTIKDGSRTASTPYFYADHDYESYDLMKEE